MTVVNWDSEHVNTKFFSFNKKPKDNTKKFSSVNGRVIGYRTNTKDLMEISCRLRLNSKTEENNFWNWFTNVLGGCSGYFSCSALGSAIYCFSEVPEPEDTELTGRTLSLAIEEVM